MQQVVTIAPDGVVSGLEHKAGFNMKRLGNASIARASEMIFNEENQAWQVVFLNGNAEMIGLPALDLYLVYKCGIDNMAIDWFCKNNKVYFTNYHEAAQAEIKVLDYYRLKGSFR